jgi:transposase
MEYFAGIDVSLEQSSVCVVDGAGKIVRETKVASEPEALVQFSRDRGDADRAGSGPSVAMVTRWLGRGRV